MSKLFAAAGVLAMAFLTGCVTPDPKPDSRVELDSEPIGGGIQSQDIRTVASQMGPELLALPEIAEHGYPVRILTSDIKNSSRFLFDKNLFLKKLRSDLNSYGRGKLRFIDTSFGTLRSRAEILGERQEETVRQNLKTLGREIAQLEVIKDSGKIVRVAVIPVLNTNLVNLNGNSFTAMLRSAVVSSGKGKIQFLLPGVTEGADYWLTGQFYPESTKTEGIINMANYISVIDNRLKNGQSLDITEASRPYPVRIAVGNVPDYSRMESELVKMLRNPAYRANPNVRKILNIMLVDPKSKAAVFEKDVLLEQKITANAGRADFILTGEISSLSQRARGSAADYILVTLRLVDPVSNEVIWEKGYEVKRVGRENVVYQ